MSDEGYKALAIIIPSFFSFVGILISVVNQYKINKGREDVKVLHETVNGKISKLLEVSKVADTATGKEEGIAQEKEAQKERDNNK